MAVPVKLGVALVVALASNVSLFSMLLLPKKSTTPTTATTTPTTVTIVTTTTEHQDRPTIRGQPSFDDSVLPNKEITSAGTVRSTQATHPTRTKRRKNLHPKPRRGDLDPREVYGADWHPRPTTESETEDLNLQPTKHEEKETVSPKPAENSLSLNKRDRDNGSHADPKLENEDPTPESHVEDGHPASKSGAAERRRSASRSKLLPRRVDADYQLHGVLSSLTHTELEQLEDGTAEVLVPALRELERVVLRELEGLHQVTRHQDTRLHSLEQAQLNRSQVKDAIKVIRQEQRKLGLLSEEHTTESTVLPGAQHRNSSAANNIPLTGEAVDHPENLASGDGLGGSGEEMMTLLETATAMTTTTTTRRNSTERSDEMIINHIYELYNSLTSMEHKVVEVDSKLTSVRSEVYRERATFDRLQDNVGEIGRNQKNLLMRSTVHTFKLSDLEQFKGQAEVLLGSAEGTIETLDATLEIFTDRLVEEEDEVEIMRDVFGRLEQMSQELRSADAFKAHDMQELKRAYQQVETRLNNMVHAVDHSMSNIRMDIKMYLDNLCLSNNLQCYLPG